MFFAPFPLLFSWLLGLLSFVVLGGGLYLLYAWYMGVLVGTGFLISGAALTLISLFGRWAVLLFRRAGADEPHSIGADTELRLTRPDGTSLYVERFGPADAPTIVLTHGAGANRTSWYYAIRALRDRFHVVIWDMPGLGHSQKPKDGDYSLERHAQDLAAVIDLLPDRPVMLVGHSMGGMVLLTLCRIAPELVRARVRGIALVDSSHTNPARTTTAANFITSIQKPLVEPVLHLTKWLAPLVWLMSWLSYLNGSAHLLAMVFGFAGSETRGQLDRAALYNPLAWPAVQASETLAMLRYDASRMLELVSVPALVCTGDLDRLIVPETADFMAQSLPDAELVRLEPAGHMSVFERHDQLVANLRAFADRILQGVGAVSQIS
jgi:pimeloyl-ACP methyl ester carboxylesterase